MRKSFTFFVAGTPRPQPRPRFVRGRVVSTADPKAKLWRAAVDRAVRLAISASQRVVPLFDGPVRLTAVFAFAPSRGNEHLLDYPHTHKPDADNLLKLVEDVMEGAGVFKNDSQVTTPHMQKWWGSKPGVQIMVEDMSEQRRAVPIADREAQAPGWLTAGGD